MRITRQSVCLLALLGAACGGRARAACVGTADSGDQDAAEAVASRCPAEPSPGACCSVGKVVCSYGTDPDPTRRDFYACDGGLWTRESSGLPADDGGACPSLMPLASDAGAAPCPGLGTVCAYDGALCKCLFDDLQESGVPATPDWVCDTSSTRDPQCPVTIPNSGVPCATPLLDCEYLPGGDASSDAGLNPAISATCDESGYWSWASTY
jgi:hypothetical protein